jgi:hypothetical protein
MPTHPASWRSILISSSHLRLRLSSGLFPSCLPPKKPSIHLTCLPFVPDASPISFLLIWSPYEMCLNMVIFYGEELSASRPTPKLEDHPMSAVRDCLFNVFAATLHIRRPFLHPQPEDAPCHGDKDPHITDYSLLHFKKSLSLIGCKSNRDSVLYFRSNNSTNACNACVILHSRILFHYLTPDPFFPSITLRSLRRLVLF